MEPAEMWWFTNRDKIISETPMASLYGRQRIMTHETTCPH